MIVDVLRNDLGRVCRTGSVRVEELCAVERYATVWQMVSTVRGELAPEADSLDLIRACFPSGSISGAPKIRAMQLIEALEPVRRGVYCGAIGYLSATGAMDTSVAIRTVVLDGTRLLLPVGGGIVADSDPDAEYEESLVKARAGLTAFGGRLVDA
jgi:para-aminobenzoate synthetase component 1